VAESELGARVAQAVAAALGSAAGYLELVTRNNPHGSVAQLLARPDVTAVLTEALDEARADAEELVRQGWYLGASASALAPAQLERLLADVGRTFDALPHLHVRIRRAHASVGQRAFVPGATEPGASPAMEAAAERAAAVRQAVLDWARSAALRARMTVSTAEGSARTLAALQAAHALRESGQEVLKRWAARSDASCCFWCDRLDGVAIPLRASFAPYLGGPARMPQASPRYVVSGAGERKFGRRAGSRIIYTQPPRLYHGDLQGPPLHPFCRCWLEIARRGGSQGRRRRPEHRTSGVFLSASEVRAVPEDRYQAELAFLRAAMHELSLVLKRLSEGL